MTYSLNTLNADRAERAPSGLSRFTQEIGLVLGAAVLAFWLLSLLSHSLADPAWSTTGTRAEVGNWGGQLGALLADALDRAARSEIAAFAMMVDAKDEAAAAFYRHHGFIALPDSPLTLFLPLATVQQS